MTLLLNPLMEIGIISPDDLQDSGVTSSGEGGFVKRGVRNWTVDMPNRIHHIELRRLAICAGDSRTLTTSRAWAYLSGLQHQAVARPAWNADPGRL